MLIIGGGLAAVRTAAELRANGFIGRLTVVADEAHAPYDRPPLSKELLTRSALVSLAGEGYGDLDELADEVLRPARALRVDAEHEGATVLVVGAAPDGDGSLPRPESEVPGLQGASPELGARAISADVVVLATGATPVVPRGLTGTTVLRTADDAAVLRAELAAEHFAPVVIIGAGWIGAELASSLADAGRMVTVLETGPAPLGKQLGVRLGRLTRDWYAEAGVDLRTSTMVAAVEGRAGTRVVVLEDKVRLDPAVVIAAVGVRPATDLVADSCLLDDTGAVIVYPTGMPVVGPRSLRVVGDAATVLLPSGARIGGGHWDGALHHPGAVAAGLMGAEIPPTPAASTFSTQFGREILTFGTPAESDSPGAHTVVREDGVGWTALVIDAEGRLAGAMTVDHPRDAAPLRRALAGGRRPEVEAEALADASTPLRSLLPR